MAVGGKPAAGSMLEAMQAKKLAAVAAFEAAWDA
jgi:hypothetical protein